MNALASIIHRKFSLKSVLVVGQILALIGSALLSFADTQERYWSFAFVGFCLGTSGVMIAFTTIKWVKFPLSCGNSELTTPCPVASLFLLPLPRQLQGS